MTSKDLEGLFTSEFRNGVLDKEPPGFDLSEIKNMSDFRKRNS